MISSQVKYGWMHFNVNSKKPFWLPGQWWVWIDLFAKQFVNILIISAWCQRLDATNSTGWSVELVEQDWRRANRTSRGELVEPSAGGKPFNLADWLEITGPSLTRRVGKNTQFIAAIKCRRCSAMHELSFCPHLLHRRHNLDLNLRFLWRTSNAMCAFNVVQNKGASSASL